MLLAQDKLAIAEAANAELLRRLQHQRSLLVSLRRSLAEAKDTLGKLELRVLNADVALCDAGIDPHGDANG